MRRLVAAILVLVFSGSVAFAETKSLRELPPIIDFTEYSDFSLQKTYEHAEREMLLRGLIEKEAPTEKEIVQGIYEIGSSMSAGGYTFTSHHSEDPDDNFIWTYIGVFRSKADAMSDDPDTAIFCDVLAEDGASLHYDFRRGEILYVTVSGGSCTFIKDE